MTAYPPDTIIRLHPFKHYQDGEDVFIGLAGQDSIFCIPSDGLDILQSLASGRTVGETVRRYEEEHGQTPDIDDFLHVLSSEGFLAGPGAAQAGEAVAGGHRRSWSLDWISPEAARRLCGPVVLTVCGILVAIGLVALAADRSMVPTVGTLLFPKGYFAALTFSTLALAIVAVMLHELAHAVVARSIGGSARVGLGNLMYVLVAQTDITGIWLAPKRKRYLAFMSGTIVDLVMASLIIDALYANHRGWIHLNQTVALPLLSAFLFTYGMRISFQLLFYLRTDVYYVVATAMSCKNLMTDTEALLRNRLAGVLRRPGWVTDQSSIPQRERNRIRAYAGFYLGGRVFWLGVLVFWYIPLLWGYLRQFVLLFMGRPHQFGVIDFLTVAILAFLIDGGGIVLWVRSIWGRLTHRLAHR